MPSLFVVRGRDQGKHFQLTEPVTRIGREATSDLQLFDSEVSRSHAEIRMDAQGVCQLVDLGSSNGSRINGHRIHQEVLKSGDRLEIGSTLLIFTGAGNPSTMETAHGIDIVMNRQDGSSRIVSSLSHSGSGSNIFSPKRRDTEADRSLEVMYLTAIAVGRTGDLDQVLHRVLQLVFDWVEADRGCVMLKDPESGQLQPAARCDRPGANQDAGHQIAISHTILDYVMEHKEGVRTSDASDDSRFESAASIVQGGVREALCVPLQGRYDIVGALYVDTYTAPGEWMASGNRQRFTDDHLRLITAIGHQAALAIEDTFYYSALLQSERLAAMGQTIATLSHHVKNILQGIRGGSYLIEAGLQRDDTEAVRKGWRIVDRNQERISHLVMDMLTFSKEREPEKIEADLNETVTDIIELMKVRAEEANVSLGCHLSDEMPPATFDPEGLHRAILNLVTNAIDAASGAHQHDDDFESDDQTPSAETGKVFVQTGFDPTQGWWIDVIDNGPGIPAENRHKIFSLFESGKGMRGTGLGLPVSAKIVQEHGGTIDVLNAPVGQGTCFRIRLPADGTSLSEVSHRDTMV